MITHVAIKYTGRTYSLPKPNRHHNVIRPISQENGEGIKGPDVQGFLDNYGSFLTRKEAMQHAKQSALTILNCSNLKNFTPRTYGKSYWTRSTRLSEELPILP